MQPHGLLGYILVPGGIQHRRVSEAEAIAGIFAHVATSADRFGNGGACPRELDNGVHAASSSTAGRSISDRWRSMRWPMNAMHGTSIFHRMKYIRFAYAEHP